MGGSAANVRNSVFDPCRRERSQGAAIDADLAHLHFLVRRERSHRRRKTAMRFCPVNNDFTVRTRKKKTAQ
jgi:hypothetical protein